MKCTEKKFKAKGIKGRFHTHSLFGKYDRNYVASQFNDVTHLPFSRTSARRDARDDMHLDRYLNNWFKKQVGKSVDVIFHNFKCLGWDSTWDMYYYWDMYVREYDQQWYYYVGDNGCLTPASWNIYDSKPDDNGDEDEENEDEKPKAVRRHASEKRLTRKLLEYNDSVRVLDMGERDSHIAHPELMGEFYIEFHHKVIKCPVYHIKYPLNPEYTTFTYYRMPNTFWYDYIPVKIKGLYHEERKFVQHHWETKVVSKFNTKEQILEAEIIHNDNGYGELQPCVRRGDVRYIV